MKKFFLILSFIYSIGLLFFLVFEKYFLRDLLINFSPYIVLLHIPFLFVLGILALLTERSFQRTAKLIIVGIAISMLFQAANIFASSFSFETTKATPMSLPPLKVLFSNVMKFNNDPSRLLKLIEKEKPDIIGIAELTPVFSKAFEGLKESFPFRAVFPATTGFGIGLYSKYELFDPMIVTLSNDIPFIKSRFFWNGKFLDLFVVHLLPPVTPTWFDQRNTSLEELSTFIRKDNPTVVMGDFNLTPWSAFYKHFTKQTGLKNARNFRNGFQMSWYGYGFYLPIDHIFHSSDIVMNRFEIGPDIGSDHYPLISELTH